MIQPGTQVTLPGGVYRGKGMSGTTGILVKEYQNFNAPKDGWDGFITIRTDDNNIRVKTTSSNFAPYVTLEEGDTMVSEAPVVVEKTDEERISEIKERFEILDEMTQASVDGIVRGMVVTGPPGVGKSYGVEKVIEKNSMFDKLADKPLKYGI